MWRQGRLPASSARYYFVQPRLVLVKIHLIPGYLITRDVKLIIFLVYIGRLFWFALILTLQVR
jgi:hypothetical protein